MAVPNVEDFFHILYTPIYFYEGKMAPMLGYKMFNFSRRRAYTQ